MVDIQLLLVIAVLLPPTVLDVLGEVVEERVIDTPYGQIGPLARRRFAAGISSWVQPYSGSSTRTDPRATVLAAQALGVHGLVVWDRAVALNPVLQRGQPAVVIDTIDGTRRQPATLGSNRPPEPIEVAPLLGTRLPDALRQTMPFAPGVVYLGVDGPRRETAAEARMFRQWGADVLGQNMLPEVLLADELGIPWAGFVTVTDHAADHAANRTGEALPGEVRSGLEQSVAMLPMLLQNLKEAP